MLKVNKDNVEIEGDITEILAEMAELIMTVKADVLSPKEQSQLIDTMLLDCVRADDEIEFLTDEERHWEKLKDKIAKLERRDEK